MKTTTKFGLIAGASVLAAGAIRANAVNDVERVPYEVVEEYGGIEIRRYPETVLVETTAPDQGTAFRRLFRYISGANEGQAKIAMTAPVRTPAEGTKISMTAPVRSRTTGDGMTMAFYLPDEYSARDAPRPTDPKVRLLVEPARTVAVKQFSWFTNAGRVERKREQLLDVLETRGWEPDGEPQLLRYDSPWTPPFMRTNEVVVPLAERTEKQTVNA